LFRQLENTLGDRASRMTNKTRTDALLKLIAARRNGWADETAWAELIRDHLASSHGRAPRPVPPRRLPVRAESAGPKIPAVTTVPSGRESPSRRRLPCVMPTRIRHASAGVSRNRLRPVRAHHLATLAEEESEPKEWAASVISDSGPS
jgi:hypothetical protein